MKCYKRHELICFTFTFLVFLFPSIVFSETDLPLEKFHKRVQQEIEDSLERRDGVVIWLDKNQSQNIIFGNSRLLNEKFLSGSLVKLILSEIALDKKIDFHYFCKGSDLFLGKKKFCWSQKGHGELDLSNALSRSCNLFFIKLGQKIGLDSILEKMDHYYFSESKKITQNQFQFSQHFESFLIGDYKGFKVSPLEVFHFWNQFLTNILKKNQSEIEQGLLRVVTEGTASKEWKNDFLVFGKTGTGDALNKNYKTNGWFLAAYPANHPRYLLLVFLKKAHGFYEPVRLGSKIFYWAEKERIIQTNKKKD